MLVYNPEFSKQVGKLGVELGEWREPKIVLAAAPGGTVRAQVVAERLRVMSAELVKLVGFDVYRGVKYVDLDRVNGFAPYPLRYFTASRPEWFDLWRSVSTIRSGGSRM